MRVLITGGNGYVGRTLTRLLSADHEVGVLDNLRYGQMRLTPDDLSRIRFYGEDLRDANDVADVVDDFKPEAIVHLAAIHFIPECEKDPENAIATNVTGTLNLLRAAKKGTRFILASTAAVYAPEDRPHHEEHSAIGPMDVYGYTKLHAEHYVTHWTKQAGLRSVIVRLFNVIGPGETNPHILPAIMAQALRGDRLRLGNCHPKRDYIDVDDVAAGFRAVLLGNPADTDVDVVNLGTGCAYSVYDIVERLALVAGRAFSVETDPTRVRPSDRPFLAADISRIRRRYGWTPTRHLKDSLQSLWSNPDIPHDLLAVS